MSSNIGKKVTPSYLLEIVVNDPETGFYRAILSIEFGFPFSKQQYRIELFVVFWKRLIELKSGNLCRKRWLWQ